MIKNTLRNKFDFNTFNVAPPLMLSIRAERISGTGGDCVTLSFKFVDGAKSIGGGGGGGGGGATPGGGGGILSKILKKIN